MDKYKRQINQYVLKNSPQGIGLPPFPSRENSVIPEMTEVDDRDVVGLVIFTVDPDSDTAIHCAYECPACEQLREMSFTHAELDAAHAARQANGHDIDEMLLAHKWFCDGRSFAFGVKERTVLDLRTSDRREAFLASDIYEGPPSQGHLITQMLADIFVSGGARIVVVDEEEDPDPLFQSLINQMDTYRMN